MWITIEPRHFNKQHREETEQRKKKKMKEGYHTPDS